MTTHTVVINYGMPRSGTTLVQKMLELGVGYFHVKLCEFHPLHPMNDPTGLVTLANAFVRRRVILVRTARALDEVRESMAAGNEMGNPHAEIIERLPWYYTQEKQGARYLKESGDLIDDRVDLKFIEFLYDDLGDTAKRAQIIARLARHLPQSATNRFIWNAYLDQVWGTKPVNVGRLMQIVESNEGGEDGDSEEDRDVPGDADV